MSSSTSLSRGFPYRCAKGFGWQVTWTWSGVNNSRNAHFYFKRMNVNKSEPKICSICGNEYTGYGCNAQPVNDGQCCQWCDMIVTNNRIQRYKRALSPGATKQ